MRKIVATAALTIGAMAITGGTSYAAPEQPAQDVQSLTQFAGQQSGVYFDAVRSDADKTVTTIVSGGTFVATGTDIQLVTATGEVAATLPVAFGTDSGTLALQPQILDGGTKLVAQPVFDPVWYNCSPSSPRQRSIELGFGIGATLGVLGATVIGLAITVATMGIGALALPFIAIGGFLLGGAIGGAAGGAIPNSDQQDAWECSGP
ncbi:hypothetical protein D7D52_05925 [Nocardia yunnanensis]|uniref:DUF8020 domain-containing protein n=1 Tax=Nocardia yunnanensis TaxID=2382165 RepID=A0A386Z8H1_9NOCA|nr:hypothetical protein [Nocardia yunnanensis]AYF73473.1 hypothetical protein D7D52_05925 [Nocardia yunnanensis]